jgi:hypothetical protein
MNESPLLSAAAATDMPAADNLLNEALILPAPTVRRLLGKMAKSTFYSEIRAGRLEALKHRSRTYVTTASIRSWIAALPKLDLSR